MSARVYSVPVVDVAVTAVSIQEQVEGWLKAISQAKTSVKIENAYNLLVQRLWPTWQRFAVFGFSTLAQQRFDHLRGQRLNVGMMDLRIAAIALECHWTLVTRNAGDFGRVPGLTIEDWSV